MDKHPINSNGAETEEDRLSYAEVDDENFCQNKEALYKIELFDELQDEVAETKSDNERLQQILADRDRELIESSEAIRRLQNERESLRRKLDDLQSTLEFQEAKMDRGSGKSSSERRSLRRKKSSVGSRPAMSPTSPEPETVRFSILPLLNKYSLNIHYHATF